MRPGRGLLWLLLPTLLGASDDPLALGRDDLRRLEDGGVIVRFGEPPDGKGVVATSIALVDAPPARVFPLVRDCGRFAEIFPRIEASAALPAEDGAFVCDITIDLPFPMKNPRSFVLSKVSELPGGGFRRSYALTDPPSDYHRNEGYWEVRPWSGGRQSLVINHMSSHAKQSLPSGILEAAQKRTAPESFAALRAAAARQPEMLPADEPRTVLSPAE